MLLSRIISSFLVPIELFETITAEICPFIVWGTVGMDRQSGLLLVQEHLEEHILVGGIAAIEDELHIRSHGKHAGTPPATILYLVKVCSPQVVAIDTDQTY